MAKVGRPPEYESPEQLEQAINDYFIDGVKIKQVLIGKAPNQIQVFVEVPTITGLTRYLGFDSRQSFYDYEKRAEFSYTVKRARLFIEQEYEEQLLAGNTVGAIFALKNMGWIDERSNKLTGELTLTQIGGMEIT